MAWLFYARELQRWIAAKQRLAQRVGPQIAPCGVASLDRGTPRSATRALQGTICGLQRGARTKRQQALVRKQNLGLPQASRQAFTLLHEADVLDAGLCERMQAMVGFRNIAVHDYQALSLPVVRSILEHRLIDFERFTQAAMNAAAD